MRKFTITTNTRHEAGFEGAPLEALEEVTASRLPPQACEVDGVAPCSDALALSTLRAKGLGAVPVRRGSGLVHQRPCWATVPT